MRGVRKHAVTMVLVVFFGGVALAGLMFMRGLWATSWSTAEVSATKLQAIDITYALHKYYLDHRAYPQTLESLVPDYLRKIDEPTARGSMWCYRRREEHAGYVLDFSTKPSGLPPSHYYMSWLDQWEFDDGD